MKDIFIILTGSSLNTITEEEKEYIRSCPTITTSLYPLYGEWFDVVPDHFIFAGPVWDQPTISLIEGGAMAAMAEIHRAHDLHTTWYVDKETKIYLEGGPRPLASTNPNYDDNVKAGCTDERIQRSIKKCTYNENLKIVETDCGEGMKYHHGCGEIVWADTIDDTFWFSSSIGTCINLATILYPNSNIKLIGNDGGACNYFYSEKAKEGKTLSMFNKPLISYALGAVSSSTHYNVRGFNIPYMLEQVRSRGSEVYNCNYNSMFSDTSTTHEFDEFYTYDEKIPYKSILE